MFWKQRSQRQLNNSSHDPEGSGKITLAADQETLLATTLPIFSLGEPSCCFPPKEQHAPHLRQYDQLFVVS